MFNKSIKNPGFLKITDESTKDIYFGCDQNWFPSEWQRRAGCGPSVASNIFRYLTLSGLALNAKERHNSKAEFIALMEEMWQYITPTLLGVNKTSLFYKGFLSYSKIHGINVAYSCFNVPKRKTARKKQADLLNFLEEAISHDTPVAFLNLHHGEEKNLDSWHWVTIISIEYTEDRQTVLANILDGGSAWKIDLSLWYRTTRLGGGFVYFKNIN